MQLKRSAGVLRDDLRLRMSKLVQFGCLLPRKAVCHVCEEDGKPRSSSCAVLLVAGSLCLYLGYLTLLEAVLLPLVLCLVLHWVISSQFDSVEASKLESPLSTSPISPLMQGHFPLPTSPQAADPQQPPVAAAVDTSHRRQHEQLMAAKAADEAQAVKEEAKAIKVAAEMAAVEVAKVAEKEAAAAKAATAEAKAREEAAAAKAAEEAAASAIAAEEAKEARAAAKEAERAAAARAAEVSKLRKQVADLEVDKAAQVYQLRKESEQVREKVINEMQEQVREELEEHVREELAEELQQQVGEQLMWLTEAVEATDLKYEARMVEVRALRQQVVSLQSQLAEDSASGSASRSSTPPSSSISCRSSRRESKSEPPSTPPLPPQRLQLQTKQRAPSTPPPPASPPPFEVPSSASRRHSIQWPPGVSAPPPPVPLPANGRLPTAANAAVCVASW